METDGMLKVGMLTASVSRNAGGIFDAIRGLARALHQPPATDIRVFGIADGGTAADIPRWSPVPVDVARPLGPRAWGYAPDLGKALNGSACDLLHTHGLWMYPSVAGLAWAKRHRKPYIVAPHGMLDPWAVRHSGWKKRLAGRLYEAAHLGGAACLHALCAAEAQAIRAYGLRAPICVVPNGVALPDAPARDPQAWQGAVPEGARVMLYLGRLHPKKGLPELLRGWDQVRRGKSRGAGDWHLAIVGWDQGGHRAALETLCRDAGITGSVHFFGPRFGADKARMLASADAFVLPSLSEGLPMTVLEAWAHRLPVLMTPHCNLDVGFAEEAALRIEATAEDIARGLDTIFAMPDRTRQALGRNGRRLAETRFSWPRVAAEMRAVYAWVLGGGTRPDSMAAD